jgi:hypothetical protein
MQSVTLFKNQDTQANIVVGRFGRPSANSQQKLAK